MRTAVLILCLLTLPCAAQGPTEAELIARVQVAANAANRAHAEFEAAVRALRDSDRALWVVASSPDDDDCYGASNMFSEPKPLYRLERVERHTEISLR
jgi:hypothetical protein